MNSIHQIHRFSKRYSIEDLRYACHGQAVPLVHICGLTTAEYSHEKIERQRRINEAVELIEYSKECQLQSGQTMYEYLKESYQNKQALSKRILGDTSSEAGALR